MFYYGIARRRDDLLRHAYSPFSANLLRCYFVLSSCVGLEVLVLSLQSINECKPTCIVIGVDRVFSKILTSPLMFVVRR